jgi:hypothetical protein
VSKTFSNPNQLEEWVVAALGITERFGIEKALGYLIGEKFYNLVRDLFGFRKMIRMIDEQRKQPNYTPVIEKQVRNRRYVMNLDEVYDRAKARIIEREGLLVKFVFLINQAFPPHEIRKYFDSHPRLGVHGHISTEEDHDFLVEHGAIEHSIDTEVQNALILGDMMKYFGINV